MKRKTYEKKIRNFVYQVNRISQPTVRRSDRRVQRPDFGFIPKTGRYAGTPVVSYQQMWDIFVDAMKGTPIEGKI